MSSPLSSANPDALTLLFETGPLELSDAQVLSAIHELRRRRSVFQSEEAAKAMAPKKSRAKSEAPVDAAASVLASKPTSEIDLDDL